MSWAISRFLGVFRGSRLRRNLSWLLAATVVLLHLAMVESLIPHGDRWYVSPDDGDAYTYSKAVRDGGWPIVKRDALVPAYLENESLLLPAGTFQTRTGEFASTRAPAIFFLASFLASEELESPFWLWTALIAGSFMAIYLLLRSISGPFPAVVGLALFVSHSSVLFWSWFPRSNIIAMGWLSVALWLGLRKRLGARMASLTALGLTPLFRFELTPIAAVAALGLLMREVRLGGRTLRGPLTLLLSGAAGASITAAVGWSTYGTLDFGLVITGGVLVPGTPIDVLPSRSAVFAANWDEHANLFAFSGAATIALLFQRTTPWTLRTVCLSSILLFLYLLTGDFSAQPIEFLESPTRYSILLAFCGSLSLAVLAKRFRGSVVPVAATVVLTTLAGISGAVQDDAMPAMRRYLEEQQVVVKQIQDLPANTVLVGQYLGNAFPSRYVFYPERIEAPAERQELLVNTTFEVLANGGTLAGEYRHGWAYAAWIDRDSRMRVVPLPGGNVWRAELEEATVP